MIPNSTPPGGPPSWNDGQKIQVKNYPKRRQILEVLILYIFGMFKFLFLKSSLRSIYIEQIPLYKLYNFIIGILKTTHPTDFLT